MRVKVCLFLVVIFLLIQISPAFCQQLIGIAYPFKHQAFDDIIKELQQEISKQFPTDLEFRIMSAQGNKNQYAAVISELESRNPVALVTIGTDLTTVALSTISPSSKINIIFAAVTDPVGAKFVDRFNPPHKRNISGVTDTVPGIEDATVDIVKSFVPNAKKIGIIYNPAEENSVFSVNQLKKAAAQKLDIMLATVDNDQAVSGQAERLALQVDAIIIPKDHIAVGNAETIVSVGRRNGIPVFSEDSGSVEKNGVLAAASASYVDVGHQTALLVAKVLKGIKARELPVSQLPSPRIFINSKSAEKWKLKIPSKFLKQAIIY